MIKLSDYDIDTIINSVIHAFNVGKSIRGRDQQINYVTDYLKIILKNTQAGMRENVCNRCMGTGYKAKE
jgi:hypothetical protein